MSSATVPSTQMGATPVSRPAVDSMELLLYWRSVYKYKWWILALAAISAAIAAFALSFATPTYRAMVTLLVEQNKTKVVSIEEVYSGVSANREHYQTQAEILKSPALAARVIEKLGLTQHPEFDPRQRQPSFLQRTLGLASAPENRQWSEEVVHGAVLADFLDRVTVEPVRLSQLVKVGFESADREFAAKVANTIADTYIEADVDMRYAMTQRATDWLAERVAGLRHNLDESERALQEFREREGMLDTKGLAQSGTSRQIELSARAAEEARERRFETEHAYNQVKGAKADIEAYPVLLRDSQINRLVSIQGAAEKSLATLSTRYGPEHIRVITARKELENARENTRRGIEAAIASYGKNFEIAKANERAVEKTLGAARDSVLAMNRKEFQLEALERDVVTNRNIYERFVSRYKETTAAPDARGGVVARVVDPAIAPGSAFKPPKERIIQISFALGLLLAAIGAVLRERMDSTIKSGDEIETKLGLPTLAVLPMLAGAKGSAGRHYLDEPRSIFSEAIRTARTSILLSAIDASSKILLVTSSVPGEGKSALATNLALAHAQTKKVLLIEADLRRPSIAPQLGLDPNKPGLTDLFAGTANFAECVQRVEGSSLYILPAGAPSPNPLELFSSERFRMMLERVAGACEIVIIDSPPVHLVSDAVVLSTMATGVLFVVKADSTPYQVARRVVRTLQDAGADILGVALNQLDFTKADRYYGAYTGYSKEYGSLEVKPAQST